MKHIKTLLVSLALTTSFAGCDMSDFDDINVSPNSPSEAYTSMLFTGAGRYVRYFIMTSYSYDPWMQEWTGYISEAKNNQYGPLGTTTTFSTSSYYLYPIKNLNEIVELNEDEETASEASVLEFGDNANQTAAAMTLRAWFYTKLTDILGAIPYSEAFKGESEDNWLPDFDSQESIYTALNEELEEAYNMFDETGSLSNADIFYAGDISKWKKFNASLRMMLAIKLADVDPSTGKTRFAKAYNDGAMEDVDDGFNYTFDTNSYSWFYYIGNANYSSAGLGFGPNEVLVEALKELKDNRLFVYCDLSGYLGDREGDEDDFDAYIGIPFGLESNSAVNAAASVACSVAASYCEAQATYGVITTARTLLVEAEAAERGWISADANELYEAGIRASYEFSGAEGIEEYLTSEKVVLSNDTDEALEQIVMQRFLAGFLTDGIEAWSDWRRFNIPTLPIYEGQAAEGITVYPYRMAYSDNDKLYNEDNANAAINTYLNGNDDRWERVWWDVYDNE